MKPFIYHSSSSLQCLHVSVFICFIQSSLMPAAAIVVLLGHYFSTLHQTVRFISFLLAFYPLIGRVLNPSLRQLVSNQVTLLLLGEPDLSSFESRGNTGSLIGKACTPRTAQGLNPTPGPLLHVVLPLLPSFPVISRLSLSSQRPQNKTKKESINKNIVLLCFKLQCLLWHPN